MTKFFKNYSILAVFFYISLFLLCFFLTLKDNVIDNDLWSRLIMGHHVFMYGSPMKHDIVSYTPVHNWIDHEWLSSFVIFTVLKYFGSSALVFFNAFLYFLSVVFCDLALVQKNNEFFYKYKIIYLFIFFIFLNSILYMHSLRCQNFSFVFYPLLIILLERYRNNNSSSAVFFVVPLMLLWLNMHGASMYGIGIIFIYLICSIFQKKPLKKLFTVFILSLLCYLINPWGPEFIKFMIDTIFVNRFYIGEWHSPFMLDFVHLAIYIFSISIFLFVYLFSQIKQKINFRTFDYTKLCILLATLILAMVSKKHNHMFYLTVFIYLYDDFRCLFDCLLSKIKNQSAFLNKINALTCVLYAFSILFLFYNFSIDSYYLNTTTRLPKNAVNFIVENNIKGNLFAPYYHCGFIAYKAYPDVKIYMDGRLEQVYEDKLIVSELSFLNYGFMYKNNAISNYKPDIILLEKFWPANNYLYNQDYYQKIYEDKTYVMYVSTDKKLDNYKFEFDKSYFNQKNLLKSKFFN